MKTDPSIVSAYHTAPAIELSKEPIDCSRPLRVIIIGAGFAGIATAYNILRGLKNVEFVIFEKNKDFGGTWLENRYPGVACDVPAHCYQFSFTLNTEWTSYYPPGQETLRYLQDVAHRLGLAKRTKFGHRVVDALWSEDSGRWTLTVERAEDGSRFRDTAHIVVSASGILNRWDMPDIPGIDNFKGQLVHTANWNLGPVDSRWGDRRVAVIGCGSTGTQIVPAMQPHVKQLDNYVRGRTWISNATLALLSKYPDGLSGNHVFTEEEKRAFRENPEVYTALRVASEDFLNSSHAITIVGSKLQQAAQRTFTKRMKEALKDNPHIAEGLIPDFPVVCRRLTAGNGYLAALQAPNAQYINAPIRRITADGIETADGQHRSYDVIVAATGFDTSFVPRFPVIGRNGANLQDIWKEYPRTYLGVCQDTHPNWFQLSGPNTATALGSLIPVIEAQAEYIVACIGKIQRERIKAMTVRKEAVDDFQIYVDSYFPRTVFARKCPTWYKRGDDDGKVVALWPGSGLNELRALEYPRFEDYEYTFIDENESQNRLYWLGNGSTVAEDEGKPGTRAWHVTRRATLAKL